MFGIMKAHALLLLANGAAQETAISCSEKKTLPLWKSKQTKVCTFPAPNHDAAQAAESSYKRYTYFYLDGLF